MGILKNPKELIQSSPTIDTSLLSDVGDAEFSDIESIATATTIK